MDLPWVELSRNLGHTILGELWPLQNAAELLPWASWLGLLGWGGSGAKGRECALCSGEGVVLDRSQPTAYKVPSVFGPTYFFFLRLES